MHVAGNAPIRRAGRVDARSFRVDPIISARQGGDAAQGQITTFLRIALELNRHNVYKTKTACLTHRKLGSRRMPNPRHATDAELAVLKVLWDHAPRSAREIADILYPGGAASDIATVQKLLSRLEAKRLVLRERKPPAHEFRPALTQDQFAGEQLEAMADKLSDGSLTPFVLHLVNARKLTARERQQIRKLLDG
jgi:BlaI family transcriptional regulator, penicillinase repressor